MLFQITEPTSSEEPINDPSMKAVGIDLGTTNSVVVIAQEAVPKVLKKEGKGLIPSVVTYEDDAIIVGARSQLSDSPTVSSIKRLMGRSPQEVDQKRWPSLVLSDSTLIRLSLGGRLLTPSEISSHILSHLKSHAESCLGEPVTHAVITVPAYFDEGARKETRDAAQLAGIHVLRLLNEPTAAALAYGLDQGVEGLYAVYDLGGGTFDLSLLHLHQGVFQVLATGGDLQLGGDDLDEALLLHLLKEREEICGLPFNPLPSPNEWQEGLRQTRHLKETLTTQESASITLTFEGTSTTHNVPRGTFESIIQPFIEKTLRICQEVWEAASQEQGDLKLQGVVLVGGATRIPCVQRAVHQFFGMPPLTTVDPDLAVAFGAALHAEALTTGGAHLLLDVTPLSLGLETMGGLTEKIIPRYSPLPASRSSEFTTYQEGQTGLLIHVVQGERDFVKDCRSLGRFELIGIPPLPAGVPRIEVTFTVDVDGLLTVKAREKTTGIEQKVHMNPSYGLTEEDLRRILLESHEMKNQDQKQRQKIEDQIQSHQFKKER